MPNIEAETVAKIIVGQVVTRFCVPTYIHSDQGRQYKCKLFSEMCVILVIKKTITTPYHPLSDGMLERFNRTWDSMLSAFVGNHQRDLDIYLPFVMLAYSSAEHETSGLTPNYLIIWREVSLQLYIMYEVPCTIKGGWYRVICVQRFYRFLFHVLSC